MADHPEALLNDLSWVERFGEVIATEIEDYDLVRSCRVHFEDGSEVEFGVAGAQWIHAPVDAGTARVMSGGLRIVYDPAGRMWAAFDAVLSGGGECDDS